MSQWLRDRSVRKHGPADQQMKPLIGINRSSAAFLIASYWEGSRLRTHRHRWHRQQCRTASHRIPSGVTGLCKHRDASHREPHSPTNHRIASESFVFHRIVSHRDGTHRVISSARIASDSHFGTHSEFGRKNLDLGAQIQDSDAHD